MSVELIGMYATGTGGSQDAVAQVDIPINGRILGLDWDCNADIDLDGETFYAELSFSATNQTVGHDVRSRISTVSAQGTVLTAVGVNTVSIQKYVNLFDLAVSGGERLFIHIVAGAGVLSFVRIGVIFEMGVGSSRTRRRG